MAVAIAGLAITAASAAFSFFGKRKAAKKQEQAFELTAQAITQRENARKVQARLEQLKLARQRRSVAREARAARGQALQAGATSGASVSSSSIAGGVGGAESVEGASQAFLSQSAAGAQEISDFLGKASIFETAAARKGQQAQSTSAQASAVGSAGSAIGSLVSSFK